VLVIAILTMTFGNVMALWQENVRRLLAYSSIAHAGYILIGVAVGLAPPAAQGKWDGLSALLFYLCVYAVATIGAFAALEYLGRRDRQIEAVEELAGLGRTRPLLAVAMAVFMFSLAGIPPLAGFWGKLYVFGSAVGVDAGNLAEGSLWPWFLALAVVGVLNAAVAAAYYLRVVGVMYFRPPLAALSPQGGVGVWLSLTACLVLTIALGLLPGPLFHQSAAVRPGIAASGPSGQQPSVAAELNGDRGWGPEVGGQGLRIGE
jgi:NADH-quinone oxidoreductase subunit N